MTLRITPLLSLALLAGTAQADDASLLRCRALADARARLECYDAIAVAATPAAEAQPREGVARFGLPAKAAELEPESIESTVLGDFDGWRPNERIRLANGQVWQITDDSRGAVSTKAAKVTVRRGALGAYFLDIEGVNRSPKVRRVQ